MEIINFFCPPKECALYITNLPRDTEYYHLRVCACTAESICFARLLLTANSISLLQGIFEEFGLLYGLTIPDQFQGRHGRA